MRFSKKNANLENKVIAINFSKNIGGDIDDITNLYIDGDYENFKIKFGVNRIDTHLKFIVQFVRYYCI